MTLQERVEYLAAKLNEQAATAVAAMNGGEGRWTHVDPIRRTGAIEDETGEVVVYDEGWPTGEQAEHIVLNDPHFVLAEVEYKRWLLEQHLPLDNGAGRYLCGACVNRAGDIETIHAYAPCEHLTGLLKLYETKEWP